jgi:hypothetical protein
MATRDIRTSIWHSTEQHDSDSIYRAMRASDIPHAYHIVVIIPGAVPIGNKCIVKVHDPCPSSHRTSELFPRNKQTFPNLDTVQTPTPPHITHPILPRTRSHKTPACPTKISRTSAARACSSCSNKAKAAEAAAEAARAQSKNQNSKVPFIPILSKDVY